MSEYPRQPKLPPEEYLRSRLEFIESVTLPRASEMWREYGAGFVFVEARLHLVDTQASHAAWALYDLDREARRAIRIIAGRGKPEPGWEQTTLVSPPARREIERARKATPRSLLRPSRIQYGGFDLVRAEPGSTEFLLDAYGLVSGILLSDPIQFALTLSSILGWPIRVLLRRWPKGKDNEAQVVELGNEFEFQDGDLRVGARLPAGSRVRLRYKSADGSELEIDVETPST